MISRREWRLAELRGAGAARALQDRLGIRKMLLDGDRPVDVFDVILRLGLTCMFQPLRSLLGAFITYQNVRGLIVTTERDLHLQRFTAAHELGHYMLGHTTTSLDEEVGFAARGPVPAAKGGKSRDVQEVEADAFAAELLLPKWLLVAHLRRQGWTTKHLKSPEIVYQLSLRLAVSYSATCWSLAANDIISRAEAEILARVPPKKSKEKALPGFKPPSTWRDTDIWLLTARDKGALLLGAPADRLVLCLEEHVASGYQWDFSESNQNGLVIEQDERLDAVSATQGVIGAPVIRRIVMTGPAETHVMMRERRPWLEDGAPINTYEIDLELAGRETAGLPRAAKRARA